VIRRYAPLIAMLLLGPQIQACSRWTVANETMDDIAKSKDELRVDTADSKSIEIRHPHAASDTLFGELKHIHSRGSSPDKPLARIPRSPATGRPQSADWVAIPSSEIQRISYRQADVPRMILLGLGVAALSVLALYGIALATGGPGD
jgi:hypothetical protein